METVREGYKMTEIGEIPIEWELKRLGEIANIHRGASPRPIKDPKWFSDISSHGWIRISDVTKSKKYLYKTEQYLSPDGIEKSRTVKPGDLIMSICGTIGRPIILKIEACIHDGFVKFEDIDTSKINTEFLRYVLLTLTDYFKSQGQPGTQVNLNTSIVEKAFIAIPSIKEQQKINEILSIVDEQIEQLDQLINKAKEYKLGLMQQLMIKGIGHQSFKSSIYGEIPDSWKELKLEELVDYITYGFTNPMPTTEQGPYMITAKDVKNGKIDYRTVRRTDEGKFSTELTDKSKPVIGDILITKDGTLGRVAVVDKENICINQSVAVMRPKKDKVNVKYLAMLLQSPHIQKAILAESGGSTIKHIYITKLSQTIIPYTENLEEQEMIANILSTVDNQIDCYEQEKVKYEALKKGLMQQLLTGKMRVRVD